MIRISKWSSLARGKVTESLKRVQAVMGRIKYKKKREVGLRNCVGSPKCSVNKKLTVQQAGLLR